MSYTEYNFLIRNYSKIRTVLHNISIYGCYDKDMLVKKCNISGSKYDKETRRCRLFLDRSNCIRLSYDGKKVMSVKYDRYEDLDNFLVNSYRIKTFTEQDIYLHYFIMQILGSCDNPLEVSEILDKIPDESCEYEAYDVRRKLNEMTEWGTVNQSQWSKVKKYSISEDFFSDFTDEELLNIGKMILFGKRIMNISTLGYFLEDTFDKYLKYERNMIFEKNDSFIYKNLPISMITNDEIIYKVYNYSKANHCIKLVLNNGEVIHKIRPLRVISEYLYGRQYLLTYSLENNKVEFYRIDNIEDVIMENIKGSAVPDHWKHEWEYSWCATTISTDNENTGPILVEMEIILGQKNKYIIKKIEEEMQWAELSKIDDYNYNLSIFVNDPVELIPWIRSYGSVMKVKESKYHDIDKKIKLDLNEALKNYGIIS